MSGVYEKKLEALRAYEAVFSGDQAQLRDKYTAEDRYVGRCPTQRLAPRVRRPRLIEVNDRVWIDPRSRGWK